MLKKSRLDLDIELDKLAAWVPLMLESTADAEQMDVFTGMVKLVEATADSLDLAHVHDRVQRILSDNCMVPSDEGPCA
ncbi:MAG: hypothetical protein ACOH1R_07685 [Luteimonas sp.]